MGLLGVNKDPTHLRAAAIVEDDLGVVEQSIERLTAVKSLKKVIGCSQDWLLSNARNEEVVTQTRINGFDK
jgi:hypothetical protein